MKKILVLFALVAALCLVSGCGGNKGGIKTCTLDLSGTATTVDLHHDGKKVNKVVLGMSQDMGTEIDESTLALIQTSIKSQETDGVEITATVPEATPTIVVVNYSVDLAKYDTEADTLGFANMFNDSDYSLDAFVKSLESEGATCK